MAVNMQVNLGGLLMKNPLTTASGTSLRVMSMLILLMLVHFGAVTTKGVSLNGWAGTTLQELPKPFWNVEFNWTTKSWSGSFKAT